MNFLFPGWLWAACAVPIVYWVFTRILKAREKELEKFISKTLQPAVIPKRNSVASLKRIRRFSIALVFLCLALSRPQWGSIEETLHSNGLDIVIALDVSSSMDVEDVVPSRLRRAQRIARTVIEQLPSDRVGIVAFAGSSFVASPLTTDHLYSMEILSTLSSDSIKNQGTALSIGLKTAHGALRNGAEELDEDAAQKSGSRVILLLTDAEDQEDGAKLEAKELKKNGIMLLAVGVGTEKGGPIPVRDEQGVLRGYKRKHGGNDPIVSTFHREALADLVKEAGGKLFLSQPDESEVDTILKELDTLERRDLKDRKVQIKVERFQWPLVLAFLFLFMELMVPMTLAFFFLGIVNADANPLTPYLSNEKAIEALKEKKPEDAEKAMEQALQAKPGDAVILHNLGIAKGVQGKSQEAEEVFRSGVDESLKTGNPELTSRNAYNLGSTLQTEGKAPEAIDSLLQAIAKAKEAENAELATLSRRKLEEIVKKEENKKEEEKKKEEGMKGKATPTAAPTPDPNATPPPEDPSNPQSKPTPTSSQSKSDPKEFKSKNLKPEDAERVLQELLSREKDLQTRLKREKDRKSTRNESEKDW